MTLTDTPTNLTAGESPHVRVLMDRCAGCQECIVRCPSQALSLDPVTWTVLADDAACVGCRQCVRTCPFSAIVVEGPVLAGERSRLGAHHSEELYHDVSETRVGLGSWEAALAEAARCLDCPDPTCVRGCPAHNDIPSFIKAVGKGDLDQAQRVLARTSVLPDVCSRVCDQALQCEGACTWSLAGDTPVAIGALERFICDNAPIPPLEPAAGDAGSAGSAGNGLTVAVVGSGPAGIAAASELVAAGARVSVFERDELPGGLLGWGIPDFTLPEQVARRPWKRLMDAGVDLHLDHEVTSEGMEQLRRDYDAVVVAAGASSPLRLPVPGAELEGVSDATWFLHQAQLALAEGKDLEHLIGHRGRSSHPSSTPKSAGREGAPMVLVLGAGNTAMDVARSARRLGARAICIDWMDGRFAPVRPDELEEAVSEGVEVRFSTTLERLEGSGGKVALAHLASTRQRSAGQRPEVIAGTATGVPVDLVVMAMGYRIAPEIAKVGGEVPLRKVVSGVPDRQWQASGLLANPSPSFARHQPVGLMALGRDHARLTAGFARRERTWVVGDALVGPSTVVEAMAQGKQAALSIIEYCAGGNDNAPGEHGRSHPEAPPGPHQDGPGSSGPAPAQKTLVATEDRGGHSASLADSLGARLGARGAEVKVLPLSRIGKAELSWASALVVCTWVEGFVVARVGPARATRAWLESLPPLGGMPVALLCSYAISPARTLRSMREALEHRGGNVVAERAFAPHQRSEALEAVAMALLPG